MLAPGERQSIKNHFKKIKSNLHLVSNSACVVSCRKTKSRTSAMVHLMLTFDPRRSAKMF